MVGRAAIAAREPFLLGKGQLLRTGGSFVAKLVAFTTSEFDGRARIIPMVVFPAKLARIVCAAVCSVAFPSTEQAHFGWISSRRKVSMLLLQGVIA